MSIEDIQRTTLADLEVMRKAYEMRKIDDLFLESFNAWQSAVAQGTDKKGKPIHKDFKSFFNYEKEMQKLTKPKNRKTKNIDSKGLKLVANANREV